MSTLNSFLGRIEHTRVVGIEKLVFFLILRIYIVPENKISAPNIMYHMYQCIISVATLNCNATSNQYFPSNLFDFRKIEKLKLTQSL